MAANSNLANDIAIVLPGPVPASAWQSSPTSEITLTEGGNVDGSISVTSVRSISPENTSTLMLISQYLHNTRSFKLPHRWSQVTVGSCST